MKVHVTPLLSKGILKQKWMCAMGNARGILYVNPKHDNRLRRTTRVAELKETDDGRGWPWLLFDVQLVWAKGSQFLLSGYERRIEGIENFVGGERRQRQPRQNGRTQENPQHPHGFAPWVLGANLADSRRLARPGPPAAPIFRTSRRL